jgi:hypothetical protein
MHMVPYACLNGKLVTRIASIRHCAHAVLQVHVPLLRGQFHPWNGIQAPAAVIDLRVEPA